jgi:hypothetical protein
MPRRSSVEDYFERLTPTQRPHLELLRELSLDADTQAREELKWSLPVYVRGENNRLWMLQNFKNHCSLRFPPRFFASRRAEVEAAAPRLATASSSSPTTARSRSSSVEATGADWSDN